MPKCIAAVFKAALELFRGLLQGLLLELPRELFQALFSQPKGRHSAGEARRRRAKRVRRYAPMIPAAPDPLPSHPSVRRSQDGPGERPHPKSPSALRESTAPTTAPTTILRPPSVEFEADEIALVRPYFRAHETGAGAEADRIQGRAAARLRAWGADLDHLEFGPDSAFSFGPAPDGTRAYTLDEYRDPESGPAPEPEPEPSALAAGATARTAALDSDRGVGGGADGGSGPSCDGSIESTDTFHVPSPRAPHALVPGPRVPARMSGLPHLSRIRARQQQRRARNLTGVGA